MRRLVIIAFLLLAAVACAAAQRELVDRVVAVVDEDAIFQSDLEEALKQAMIQQGKTALDEEEKQKLARQILQDLVGDRLILARARQLGIDVPFADVEKRVDQWIERSKELLGGEQAFQRQLEIEGLTLDKLKKIYRKQVRERMLVDKVISSEIDRSRLEVTEDELRRFFEEKKSELGKRPEVVHLATIFFSFQSATNAREEALKKALAVKKRLEAGESFAELARAYSEDPSAERGGDLGFLAPGDIRDPRLAQAVSSLKVGVIGGPVLSSYGYHLLQVVERDTARGAVHLRHILFRIKPSERDLAEVYRKARSVRQQLLQGAPFDSLARAVSDDTASAAAGGDLGWLKVADLPSFFQDVLAGMKEGQVSQVLRESSGFRIVKLLEREEEREYRYEEVKPQLRRMLEEKKMEEAYDEYIAKLRQEHYVKVLYP